MKNSIFILLFSLFAFWGCQETPIALTEADKEAIKIEVKATFDACTEQFSNHNVEGIPPFFLQSDELIYSGNGNVTKSWDALYEVIKSIHTNPKYQSYSLKYDEVIIKVLAKDLAIVNGKGKMINFPLNDELKSIDFADTYLMQKVDGKWLITVGHESTNEQLF